jgi:hypothetical protein
MHKGLIEKVLSVGIERGANVGMVAAKEEGVIICGSTGSENLIATEGDSHAGP